MNAAPEWITQNAEALGDLSNDETLARFGSVGDLAKSYKEAISYQGRSIAIPGENAGDDQRNEFYTKLEKVPGVLRLPSDPSDNEAMQSVYRKLGAPESPDGYEIKPEGLPEGVQIDEDLLAAIKPAAHARGVSNKQLNGLFGAMAGVMGQRAQQATESVAQSVDALKSEWGLAYDAKKAAAIGVAERIGGEDFAAFLNSHGDAAVHPGLIKTFAAIADKFGEDSRIDASAPQTGSMSPDEARTTMAEIRANRDHPFNNPSADKHSKGIARAKMYELQCYAEGMKPDSEQLKFMKG